MKLYTPSELRQMRASFQEIRRYSDLSAAIESLRIKAMYINVYTEEEVRAICRQYNDLLVHRSRLIADVKESQLALGEC